MRPGRHQPMLAVKQVAIDPAGLIGDRRNRPGKRAVTLIQAEHLPVIASLSKLDQVTPEMLRRNLVVSGISLLALKNRHFSIGSVILLGTGICAPCSRMEEVLGHGGYNAMRGHGGITAEVVQEGTICIGDSIEPLSADFATNKREA